MDGTPSKRDQRRRQILEIARDLLIEEGLIGLTFEELARRADVTRQTIYGYFSSHGEILAGVAEQNLAVMTALMERASGFEGTYRERVFGLILAYEAMARFETAEFHLMEFLGMPWVRARLPEEVASAFAATVSSYFRKVESLVEGGVNTGELVLREGVTVGNIVFHSLSMSYGIYTSIVKERIVLALSEPKDPWQEAREALQSYWDGIGWAGSRAEIDYSAVAQRFIETVFRDYWIESEVGRLRDELTRGKDES